MKMISHGAMLRWHKARRPPAAKEGALTHTQMILAAVGIWLAVPLGTFAAVWFTMLSQRPGSHAGAGRGRLMETGTADSGAGNSV